MKNTMRVFIDGIGLNGPGLPNWAEGRQALTGLRPCVASPTVVVAPASLPAAERRRVGVLVKLALQVGLEAVDAAQAAADQLASVFSSSSGEGENCHALCEALAGDRLISPTRFTNSVHNAPSGYWGIVSRSVAPSSTLCAYDGSFSAGLLEAVIQVKVERRGVLLVTYDAPYPSPLLEARPVMHALGIALVLSPNPSAHSLAAIDVALCDEAPTILPLAQLEALRQSIPCGRGLPLLQALAEAQAKADGAPVSIQRRVVLDYLNQRQLAVELSPCR
ncbi:beta-ketoacyl synthase chain length factor [Aquabacterium sp.]|uniref:beta-ketoacyl synthase chain length factor n=1 Tax=Aquabacterium sp. TaxID=1872578 RepID=UPI0019A06BC5|nr:beta-ketoacyl synthase chain length factor [Aquabacterium sp.]MBC7701072.1 beta-ketoacyl synthase chain length factor [Aquabacterium sp.]